MTKIKVAPFYLGHGVCLCSYYQLRMWDRVRR